VYEPRSEPPIPTPHFLRRMLLHLAASMAAVGGSLLLGMAGYVWFEGLPWLDGFLNSAMLLGGMGPVNMPQTPGGKLFAGTYALYAGLVFLFAAGLIIAPVFHRILHKFHFDEE
jgi:hypothetical protein